MTEKELRDKIVKILEEYRDWFIEENYKRDIAKIDYTGIADALIENGIGDVSEYKHRAEVAEKAGRIIQRDMARVFGISNPRICELITNIWDLAKKQAEKELAEEKKDD